MGHMVGATVIGFKELGIELDKDYREMERELRREIRRTAHALEAAYRRFARSHFITGKFDQSIDAESIENWLGAIIGSDLLYSIFLEVGTKAHKIPKEPKPTKPWSKWLHFFWEAVGEHVAARQVDHPGTPAYNLLLKAWIQEMKPFNQKFGKRLKDRFDHIGK